MKNIYRRKHRNKGVALIMSMIFLAVFSAFAVAITSMATTNNQLSDNVRKVNTSYSAAQSGLECGRYIIQQTLPYLQSTGINYVTTDQANTVWSTLCSQAQSLAVGGQAVSSSERFTDGLGNGDQIFIPSTSFGDQNVNFSVRFFRYDSNPAKIKMQATGADNVTTRTVQVDFDVTKDSAVMNYAIAGNGRMWLTGDTTIHGDIFSSWDREEISPFNVTSDSSVMGTINAVLTLEQIQEQSYQMEYLNEDNVPVDANGDPIGKNYDQRYYSASDEVQGYHEGINYGQPFQNMPGMDIADYDTSLYYDIVMDTANSGGGSIPASYTQKEYFPHAAGNYSLPKYSSSRTLYRHVYENQTFDNVRLPDNRNALFKNCTFEGILYIDCSKSTSSYYNNVRFEDCTFNGTIITDVPESLKWKENCLYFTGEATFNNTSDIQEATILAPHFNVNLGNTDPDTTENNVLTGAIVGGIVDVRGNAQIDGTIISMCDTTQWSSGYVTNIGTTLEDGGSETTELGDIGTITITPDSDSLLPSGIQSPIIIKADQETYTEL